MKSILICFLLAASSTIVFAQQNDAVIQPNKKDSSKHTLIVEASCGQCNFKMKGDGCSLAIRIHDTAYFVQGTGIDDHGDAHANEGFCNSIRRAEVQGVVKDNAFIASYFKLLPVTAVKKKQD